MNWKTIGHRLILPDKFVRKGAVVVFAVVAVIGGALFALRHLYLPDTSSTITQREVHIRDAVVFQGPSHDSSRFVVFVEAVTEKKGAGPLQDCQEELLLANKSYKSSVRKEFSAGDSQSSTSILVFVPQSMYRKAAKVRMVCKTTATDWYPVELPELKMQ
jgi:hypothetical protein